MNKCLVIKLKAVVNDKSLPRFATLVMNFAAGSYEWSSEWNSQQGTNGEEVTFTIEKGEGHFQNGSKTLKASGVITDVVTMETDGVMSITSKYNMTTIVPPRSADNPITDFACLPYLTFLKLEGTGVTGKIEELVEGLVSVEHVNGDLNISSSNKTTWKGAYTYSNTYIAEFNDNVVNVYFGHDKSVLSGVYSKETKTWSYT